jgi:prepilin-type N-terminal cleavage/methylation domain-containing protein
MTEPTRKRDRGVTLIELMIVLVIASLVVGGIYTLFATQQRSYFVQDQVAGVQQDARAALTIMTRDIRMAGLIVGPGSATGFSDGTIDTITMPSGNTYAVTPANSAIAPDSITVVLGLVELGLVQSVSTNVVTLDQDAQNDYFDDGYGTPNPAKLFVAFDYHHIHANKVYQVPLSGVSGQDITVTNYPSGSVTVGGRAYGVKAVTYSVTTNDGVLRRNENTGAGAQPLVGDGVTTFVEDLQFAYQVEGDSGWYNAPSEFPAGTNEADIRMVRINITVRTAVQDATVQDAEPAAQFNQPPLEDHTDPTFLNGPDGFRRRVYTTVVKVRNL